MFYTIFAILLVCQQNKLAIGHEFLRRGCDTEKPEQFVAVINSGIGGDGDLAFCIGKGEFFIDGFWCIEQHEMPHTVIAGTPGIFNICYPVVQLGCHQVKFFSYRLIVGIAQAKDCTHGAKVRMLEVK